MFENKIRNHPEVLISVLIVLIFSLSLFSQTGGQYKVEQSVVANGGGTSSGGAFSVAGTSAQSAAGSRLSNPTFGIGGGFWNAPDLGLPPPSVTIGGLISTAAGEGIRNVSVMLTQSDGTTRITVSGKDGRYIFAGILAGQTVIINIKAKRYSFTQPTIVHNVMNDFVGLDFVAQEL